MLTNKTIKKINELHKEYTYLSQGKDQLLNILAESEISEQVYNSNAIENSTLTLEETEKILLHIDLDRYLNERELFEAKNLARVVEYINNNAQDKALDIDMLLFLHKILLSNIRDDIAGRFRADGEYVRVGNHIAPAPEHIDELLENVFLEYRAKSDTHIIQRIARFHLMFEQIHPFIDGNGRIGRVLNNYLLHRFGFVPINIKFINRAQYYDAFNEFNNNTHTFIMEDIVSQALIHSYYKRITYLKHQNIIRLSDYAKKYKLSHSNLINKAKRQTISAFFEKGTWYIGDDKKTEE